MIKKVQQYLLLNYPTLWNIKLFPMLLILAGVNILFGFIGYASSAINFEDTYYRRIPVIDDGYLFVCTIFLSIFIFIGWLVFYMRNNAIKNFYPRKTYHLYWEWLLIFVIIAGIALIPFSTTLGAVTRSQTTASIKECREALDIINMAKVLTPRDDSNYDYIYDSNDPIPIPNNTVIDINEINLNLYDFEYDTNGRIKINGYRGPSLLFYKDNRYYYSYDNGSDDTEEQRSVQKQIATIKRWLKNEQRDSIYAVMTEFNKLQQKHNLKINLTPDQWLNRIYNPPFFPVNEHTSINPHNYTYDSYYYGYERHYDYENSSDSVPVYIITNATGDTIMRGDFDSTSKLLDNYKQIIPNLPVFELENAYKHILYTHTENDYLYDILLVVLCIALWLSIFVFSYRVTSGKAWLIAFISSGIMFFFILFLGILVADSSYSYEIGPVFIISFWLTIFVCLMAYTIYKTFGSREKGHSSAPMNVFLWLLPCIIPLLYFNFTYIYDLFESHRYKSFEESLFIFWIDIFVIIITMYPVSALVRKWKGIAEE